MLTKIRPDCIVSADRTAWPKALPALLIHLPRDGDERSRRDHVEGAPPNLLPPTLRRLARDVRLGDVAMAQRERSVMPTVTPAAPAVRPRARLVSSRPG
eukprot:scaffold157892_cov27-Tisochrysis_lutea.AAC.3